MLVAGRAEVKCAYLSVILAQRKVALSRQSCVAGVERNLQKRVHRCQILFKTFHLAFRGCFFKEASAIGRTM